MESDTNKETTKLYNKFCLKAISCDNDDQSQFSIDWQAEIPSYKLTVNYRENKSELNSDFFGMESMAYRSYSD